MSRLRRLPPAVLQLCRLGFAGAIFALASCAGGGPSNYVTLTAVAPASGMRAAAQGTPVAVAPVQIPPAIDRTEFTTATGATTLEVAGKVQWAGPLDGLIRLALARDLAERLAGATVLMPGDAAPPGGARAVQVNVVKFVADASGSVTLDADWWVTAPDGRFTLPRSRFHAVVPGGSKPGAEARSMSEAVARLSDRIARSL